MLGKGGNDTLRFAVGSNLIDCNYGGGYPTEFTFDHGAGSVDLNGNWLDIKGGDGNDVLRSTHQSPAWVWGEDDDDEISASHDNAYIRGDAGNDDLRLTSSLVGASRSMWGESGNDCLEDDETESGDTGTFNCGSDTDYNYPNASTNPQYCESDLTGRCVCGYPEDPCSNWSECCNASDSSCEGGVCCKELETECITHDECCQGGGDATCQSGVCCLYNGESCSSDDECCYNNCDGGTCTAP